jgi:hypothetical protein
LERRGAFCDFLFPPFPPFAPLGFWLLAKISEPPRALVAVVLRD